MKQYRQFKKMNTNIRPVLDERIIREFGHKLAGQFDRMSELENRVSGFNVNMRINYRAEAAQNSNWPSNSSMLNKMWYSFRW